MLGWLVLVLGGFVFCLVLTVLDLGLRCRLLVLLFSFALFLLAFVI